MPEHTPAPTPSRGVYGFVMYLSFQLFFVLYLIWGLTPQKYFIHIGVMFLPERHWAVTIPIYLLTVLTVFAFIIYPSLGHCMTPNVEDFRTIRDKYGSDIKRPVKIKKSIRDYECICIDKNMCQKNLFSRNPGRSNKFIPELKDLNIQEVSEHLYLQ